MPATRTTKTKAIDALSNAKTTQPVKKPYQRKAKNTANGSVPADTPEHAIGTAPTEGGKSKRKRQLTNDNQEEDNLPLKRPKGTPANADGVKRGRPRKDIQLPPARSPLPNRIVRNTHPTTPKGTRRSSEQVAADNAAKKAAEKKLLEEQIRLGEMAKLQFAQMQIDEEHAEVEIQKKNPMRLSAAKRINQRVITEVESTDGEQFDFDKAGDTSSSEESEVIVQPVRKKKAAEKAAKAATREDIEKMTEQIRPRDGDGRGDVNKAATGSGRFTHFDAAPRKYANAGLKEPRNAIGKKTIKVPEDIDLFENGGLNDEDADAARPTLKAQRFIQFAPKDRERVGEYPERDPLRRNNLAGIVDNNSDVEVQAPRKVKKETKMSKTSEASKKQGRMETQTDSAPQAGGAVFVKDNRWARTFVPTITHAFYVTREPFLDWSPESTVFLATVQHIFNLSFPNAVYTVSAHDQVIKTAYDRIKSRKSKIASSVLAEIQKFFDKTVFRDKPEKIREYVRWALRPDGPAYYETPTPQECRADRTHSDYIPPDGFLLSEFVAPIAAKFLGYAKDSILHSPLDAKHPPKGLYVLIMTAVERAFKAHMNGTFDPPRKFAHERHWQTIQVFYNHIDRLSERRWNLALQCVESRYDGNDEALRADASMISAFRADLYIPESPKIRAGSN